MAQCFSCQHVLTKKNQSYFEIVNQILYCKAKKACKKRRASLIPAGNRRALTRVAYRPMMSRTDALRLQNAAIHNANVRKANEERITTLAQFD